MKTLKQWVRGWLDWIAAKLGYTSKDYAGLLEEQVDAWREAYTNYKRVQEVAATLDNGKPRK